MDSASAASVDQGLAHRNASPNGGRVTPHRRQGQRLLEGERHGVDGGPREIGPMLTASEVAELLHLHVNTVKRLGDRGELPF